VCCRLTTDSHTAYSVFGENYQEGYKDGTDDLVQDVLRYTLQVCQNGGGNLADWVTVIEARIVKEESYWKGLNVSRVGDDLGSDVPVSVSPVPRHVSSLLEDDDQLSHERKVEVEQVVYVQSPSQERVAETVTVNVESVSQEIKYDRSPRENVVGEVSVKKENSPRVDSGKAEESASVLRTVVDVDSGIEEESGVRSVPSSISRTKVNTPLFQKGELMIDHVDRFDLFTSRAKVPDHLKEVYFVDSL
jgi:hypothetical protein